MNTLKKKSLHVAVLAGLAAVGAAGTAEAVHINPDGLGQVLIFPYYTARAGQFTAISIVNTQLNTKIVKVRFLEGKNSREVLDFNLFLSPNDVWTGAVVATTDGARVISNDNSCVTPSDLFAETRTDGAGAALNAFKNYEYTGLKVDNSTMGTLDRTREGYFEVIEMAVVDDDAVAGNAFGAAAALVTSYIKHNTAGVPANCGALDGYDGLSAAAIRFPNVGAALTSPPRGGLSGRASILNSPTGGAYTFSPTAIDAWTVLNSYTEAGSVSPKLIDVSPTTSNIFTSAGVVTATWPVGPNAMSAVLMRNTVQNEFILDAGTQSQTDWIVTFPTKRYFTLTGPGAAPVASAPFANNFHNTVNDGSCDPYSVSLFNREEQGPTGGTTLPQPSPLPPTVIVGNQLCWEANVIPFGTASLLGSTNTNPLVASLQSFVSGATSVAVAPATPALRGTQGPNGWFLMNFNHPVVAGASNTQALVPTGGGITALGGALVAFGAAPSGSHFGLPVVGAMVHNYKNTGVVSQYGGVIDHKFTRSVTP